MENTIFNTEDGSHSVISGIYGDMYHSKHGAIQEAMHVFIKSGLAYIAQSKQSINVFEMGFGTGLNAWLTNKHAISNNLNINYYAVEKHPLATQIIKQLNYVSNNEEGVFNQLHQCKWEKWNELNTHFNLFKKLADLTEIEILDLKFDLVYYDAFAPNTQPELWSTDVFSKIYNWMSNNGVLCTYCAKGAVKRTLKSVGFKVESLQGPPGKREMIRANKVSS